MTSDSRRDDANSVSGEKLSEEDLRPRYIPRVGESDAVKRARLLYQSRYQQSIASQIDLCLSGVIIIL